MPSLSELWSLVSDWLPDWQIGGIDIALPVFGLGSLILLVGVLYSAIQIWNTLREFFFPAASKKGQAITHEKLGELDKKTLSADQVKALMREVLEETAPHAASGAEPAREPMPAEKKTETVQRIATSGSAAEIAALNEIARGDVKDGVRDLKQQIGAIQAEADKLTAQKWRDIGVLAYDREPAEALNAYREAAKLDTSDTWALIYLARLELSHGDGLAAAAAVLDRALEAVGDERDRSVLFTEQGNVRRAQGDLSGALESYEAGLAIAERLAVDDAGNAEWQRDLSVSHNNIGDVRRAQGNLSGALESYEADLAIAERLVASDAGNARWQRDLSVSHEKIGNVRVSQGDLSGALESYEASHAIRERLAASDAGNAEWQRDLAISYERLGQVSAEDDKFVEARQYWQQEIEIAERLMAADPTNADWPRFIAVVRMKLFGLGEADAADQMREAIALLEVLEADGRITPPDQGRLNALREGFSA